MKKTIHVAQTMRTVGRVRKKLAKLLQENFPTTPLGVELTWRPEKLYPATGSYRTNVRLDCWRWEGFAVHIRQDGTEYTALAVGGYTKMSELIKEKELEILSGGEVVPATDSAESKGEKG